MYRQDHTRPTPPTRRAVLGAGIAAAGSALLTACSGSGADPTAGAGKEVAGPGPGGSVSTDGKKVRPTWTPSPEGKLRGLTFTATPATVEIGGGRTVRTSTYNGELPGKAVRITAGDTLEMTLANHLPEPTTIHWHGIALRNEMDGVPEVTQPPIKPGGSFTYRFQAPHPGTYWFHPHLGLQIDRAMYAPLIVDDPNEPLAYDAEWIVLLDDWIDGVGGSSPEDVFDQLRKGKPAMGHGGSAHQRGHDRGTRPVPSKPSGGIAAGYGPPGARAPEPDDASPSPQQQGKGHGRLMTGASSPLLGGHAGDVAYPHYLINGRTPDDPTQFRARPGDRIRLRIINAGAETAFRVALGGHRMTITHSDGFPVHHHRTDSLLLGMGERYDVLISAKDGVFPLTALAEGKNGAAMAVLRTASGALPGPTARPAELRRDVLSSARRLRPHETVELDRRRPDRILKLTFTGGMKNYDWGIDHRPYSPDRVHRIEHGERVRLVVINATDMWHPVHLHGHTYALAGIDSRGARKDTAPVLPHNKLVLDFDADNPGHWMLHCHNIYHSESGMMTTLTYDA
ncbi:multicopper oxidase family protein [Streptomyces sp. NBC_01142]|uniref:multicopper oxidase family protein n=1 Tax=Streptomyces sp. NBC_01142 TaxID=2975865 RepID=UPI00225BF257|nr:multicopper oxidase family protein [Streptomyces sp. NBC_01142]MCX4826281.1 multicopper oxidase family protein [Streptomyces sp. NBC_01142]